MKLSEDVYVLALPMPIGSGAPLNLTLILDADEGATLVDTGVPGQQDAIAAAMAEAGVGLADLKTIIITHQDIDHVGSLHELVQTTGAQVLAHAVETPMIDGTTPPRFADPEMLALRPQMRQLVESFTFTPVDELLDDGSRIERAGGIRAIATPGHTPGHMCLYLERSQVLIAGDALTASEGRLQGPNPGATGDMALAGQSVRKLADLDVQTIICYHGGVVGDDAGAQLRRVAQDLAATELEAGGA
jgi:glyoxylase-like metal-dependent hydrolase (beta-lactamase superfamily II)